MQLKLVHRWVGLSLCVLLLLISITGTLLLWKTEYLWSTIPDARQTVDRSNSSIALAVEKIQQYYADGEIRFIQLHSHDLSLHKLFLSERRYAWHNQQGEQLQVWRGNERWEDWLLDLHHRFLLGNTIGLNIAGFSGLLLVPLLIVGLILWWPRRRLLTLGIRPKTSAHGAWQISHVNLGAWSLLPILLLAITGVILVYPSESRWVLVGGFSEPPATITQTEVSDVDLDWSAALKDSARRYPNSKPRWLSFSNSDQPASLKVGLQQAAEWNRSGYTSIEYRAEQMTVQNGLQQSLLKRSVDFTYPLHTGQLGLWYRLVLTLFGIALSMLCIYGLGSFIKRLRRS